MLSKMIETKNDILPLILRITLGFVIFPHGAQKLFGWFGGQGFNGMMQWFTETMGIPYGLAFLVIMAESLGAIALIAGLFSRVMAFGIGASLAGAAVMVQAQNGFFMNWFGNQQGEGIEYSLLVIAISIALMIRGGGAYSLDYLFQQKLHHPEDARLSA